MFLFCGQYCAPILDINVLEVVNGFAEKHKGERIPSLEALVPKLEADYNVKVKVPTGEVRITSLNGNIV